MGGGGGFPLWVLGVILVIIGSLGNNYGNNLVSLGHTIKKGKDHTEAMTEEEAKEERGHARWRAFGIFIIVVGNLATFASFGFAAQSLLAALESVQFLSNVAFARFIHKEVITTRMVTATLMIVVGNVLVVIFSEHKAVLYDSADILYLYRTNSAYHGYLAIAFSLFFIMHFVYVKYHHARVVENRILWKHSFMEPFSFSVSAAIMGTQAVLNSKCMSMLIQVSSTTDRNEFERPTIWVILVTWIMFVAYWLRRLDKGLELFPPAFIIPVLQVFFVFFAIMCGGIYFEEFTTFGMKQWLGFIFGVFFILVGVYRLAPVDSVCPAVVPVNQEEDQVLVEMEPSPHHKDAGNSNPNVYVDVEKQAPGKINDELDILALLKVTEKPAPNFDNTPATAPEADHTGLVMDPAELAVKAKRTIVKRPTEPAELPVEESPAPSQLPV